MEEEVDAASAEMSVDGEGRKVRHRRRFKELERTWVCEYPGCGRPYASEHSLNQVWCLFVCVWVWVGVDGWVGDGEGRQVRHRRRFKVLERTWVCEYPGCGRPYASEHSPGMVCVGVCVCVWVGCVSVCVCNGEGRKVRHRRRLK